MRVLVDEDLASGSLLEALRQHLAHDAVIVLDKGLSDADVWAYAQQDRLAVLTQNAKDFAPLARTFDRHGGLLLVSRQNDPAKDLRAAGIAERVAAIADLYDDLTGFVLVVNGFDPKPARVPLSDAT